MNDAATEVAALRAEVELLRAAWLRAIQAENGCTADGRCINANRCGCVAEQAMLIEEFRNEVSP